MSIPRTICRNCEHYRYVDWSFYAVHQCASPIACVMSPVTGVVAQGSCEKINKGDCPHYERKLGIIERIRNYFRKDRK